MAEVEITREMVRIRNAVMMANEGHYERSVGVIAAMLDKVANDKCITVNEYVAELFEKIETRAEADWLIAAMVELYEMQPVLLRLPYVDWDLPTIH